MQEAYGDRRGEAVITELEDNQLFVFGSNLSGHHIGGAAKQAYEQFGAEWGIGAGITGQCYAVPTMNGIREIERYVHQFLAVAAMLPDKQFLVTKIGCGIAGHEEKSIKPLFATVPNNVILPEDWQ